MSSPPHPDFMKARVLFARNWATASRFLGVTIAIVGLGAEGSLIAELLAASGFNLILLDFDQLEVENLFRHAASRRYLSHPKVTATATTLREEFSEEQSFLAINVDVLGIPESELRVLLERADLVVGATANPMVDIRLNHLARLLGVPYVTVGLWAESEAAVGHVHLVPWSHRSHLYERRALACAACLQRGERGTLEAQPGTREDVQAVAALAARIICGVCLPDSDERARWLADRLAHGENFFMVSRQDYRVLAVNTEDAVRASCDEGSARLREHVRARTARQDSLIALRNAVFLFAIVAVLLIGALWPEQ